MRFLTLRYFHEVARLGSIRKAADRFHVAASAISRQIAQLEQELDAPLFERSKTGVKLTSAGEILTRQTTRMFRDLDRARGEIDDLRGLRRGEVHLWAMEGVVSGILPAVISRFHRQFPGVTFHVVTSSTDRMIEALLDDVADVAITFNAAPRAEIEVIAEYIEPISCLVSPKHRFANRKKLTLAEICEDPLALPDHSFGLRQVFERAVGKARLHPRSVVTTNSLEFTKTLAATGEMLAFMPALTVLRETSTGVLRVIPVIDDDFKLARASISIHRDRPLPHAARAFLKMLSAEIEALSKNRHLRKHKKVTG
jgi:DNA-binding transcriptional LysR family regulator